MTFEERLNELGVRITNTEIQFFGEVKKELEYLIFNNWISNDLFKIFVNRGFHKMQIARKEEEFSNYANKDIRFLFAGHNWFMLADMEKKTLLLYKIV